MIPHDLVHHQHNWIFTIVTRGPGKRIKDHIYLLGCFSLHMK